MQVPTPLPNLPGLPMNQPQPYIPMMPSYTQPPTNFTSQPSTRPNMPPVMLQQTDVFQSTMPQPSYSSSMVTQANASPINSAAAPLQPQFDTAPLLTSLSLPGMPPITVSASLPISTFEGLSSNLTTSQPQTTS